MATKSQPPALPEAEETQPVPLHKRPKVPPYDTWEKLRAARIMLFDRQEYLAHGVASLRSPVLTRTMPTAGVGTNKNGEIVLYFNPDFIDTLTTEELAFVMAHEALHVLSDHIPGMASKENPILWNIVCDIMVNTWLLENAKFKIGKELSDAIWASDRVGLDARTLLQYVVAEDIYDQLLPETKRVQEMIKEYLKSLLSGDVQEGDCGKEHSSAGATVDDHANWSAVNQAAVDNAIRELQQSGDFDRAQLAGKVPADVARAFADIDQDFAWEKHIERFVASVVRREETWERPNRRLVAGGFGEIMVPGSKIRYDYTIFVYVDMSGSIGPEQVSRFRAVLLRKPPEVRIQAFTFDTQIYDWPKWETEEPKGGGGTDFQAVVDHAQTLEAKTRCDGFVVLTDGYCGEPTVAKPKRWLWISTDALLSKESGTWVKMPEVAQRQTRRLFR
jgi:predicted metal-dependent peptidase